MLNGTNINIQYDSHCKRNSSSSCFACVNTFRVVHISPTSLRLTTERLSQARSVSTIWHTLASMKHLKVKRLVALADSYYGLSDPRVDILTERSLRLFPKVSNTRGQLANNHRLGHPTSLRVFAGDAVCFQMCDLRDSDTSYRTPAAHLKHVYE